MQAFYDGMAIVGSLVIMAIVIALTYFASRWYAGRMKGYGTGRHIKIVDKIAVGSGCTLIVVQASDRFYLVGVSDKNIRLLCELNDFTPDLFKEQEAPNSFGQLFQTFLNKAKGTDAPKNNGGEQ